MDATANGLYVVGSYLLGAIPVAYLYGRARRIDLSHEGTGNLGAGNTTRLLGAKAGAFVALMDGFKGLLVVVAGRLLEVNSWVLVSACLAVVAGSDWSIYLGRRSGRGLATSGIVMLVFDPITVLWPGLWSMVGWKIGGGISGFFGWAFIWVAALAMGRAPETVALGAGLGLLMIIRRAQGNLDDTSQEAVGWRILYDTDRRHPELDPIYGGESAR